MPHHISAAMQRHSRHFLQTAAGPGHLRDAMHCGRLLSDQTPAGGARGRLASSYTRWSGVLVLASTRRCAPSPLPFPPTPLPSYLLPKKGRRHCPIPLCTTAQPLMVLNTSCRNNRSTRLPSGLMRSGARDFCSFSTISGLIRPVPSPP